MADQGQGASLQQAQQLPPQPTTKRTPLPRSTIEPDPRYLMSPGTLLTIAGAFLGIGMLVGLKFSVKERPRKGTVWKGVAAFFGGTTLCAATTGGVAYGVFKYLGVNNVREFADKMKEIVPEKTEKLREIIQPTKEKMDETLHNIPHFPKKSPLPDIIPPTLPEEEAAEIEEIDSMLMYNENNDKKE